MIYHAMRVIGLTGGIASGKSTVSRMFADLGAKVVDADKIAREVVEPGKPALADIVKTFGADMLLPSGDLDRKKLGAVVFNDPQKRAQLNAITHPRIAATVQERLDELRKQGAEVAIYEAALIVENKIHLGMEGLIVVAIDEETQIDRMARRDELTREEAQKRIHAQAPLSDKIAVADWVIETNGALPSTREKVAKVWEEIRAGGPRFR
jgi:dephospho-CoA kinase